MSSAECKQSELSIALLLRNVPHIRSLSFVQMLYF